MSGNVVPATGDVQFLSNASSNAVCQVFGLAADSSFSSLVGRAYNPSVTAAPVFVAPTVHALPLSLQGDLSGASLFLTSPNTPTISALTTSGFTPVLSGGSGTYYIALGTGLGTSNIMNWNSASSSVAKTVDLSRNTNYYISTHLSNVANGRKSLAISNSTAYGQPNDPTVTLTLANISSWSISWTESSTNTLPITYEWQLKQGSTVVTSATGISSATRTINGTTTLSYNTNYYAVVNGIYNGGFSEGTSATVDLPLPPAPTGFIVSNVSRTTANLNWNAVVGANGYGIEYKINNGSYIDSNVSNVTSVSFPIANGFYDFRVYAKFSSNAINWTSEKSLVKRLYRYTNTISFTVDIGTYTIVVAGGAGGNNTGYTFSGNGGAGGCLQKSLSITNLNVSFTSGVLGGLSGGGGFSSFVNGSTIIAPGGGGGGAGCIISQGYETGTIQVGNGGAGNSNAANVNSRSVNYTILTGFDENDNPQFGETSVAASVNGGIAGNITSDESAGLSGDVNAAGNKSYFIGGGGRGYLYNGSKGGVSAVEGPGTDGFHGTVSVSGGGGGGNYSSVATDTVTSQLGQTGSSGILIMYT